MQMAGDRERGREVFAKVCATCHQAEGRGIDVGPNLATVTNRSPEDLLVHILDPNREVAAKLRELQRGHRAGACDLRDHRRGIGQCDRSQAIGRGDRRHSAESRSSRSNRPAFR